MGKFTLTRGVQKRPDATIVTGRSNIGKTWFLSTIPNVHMVCTEDGLKGASPDHVDQVQHFDTQPKTFREMLEQLEELGAAAKANGSRHVAFDSLWGAERLINKEVCRSESVAHMDAKEFKVLWTAAQALHAKLQACFDTVRDKYGCHLWIAAHSAEITESTGEGDQFRKYDLSFEGTGNSLIQIREFWRRWADNVLFIDWDSSVKKGSIGKKQVGVYRARIFRTRETPAYYAKNRRNLPEKLPADWSDLARALGAGQTASDERLRKQIDAAMSELPEASRKMVEADLRAAKTNTALAAVLSRANGMLSVAADESDEDQRQAAEHPADESEAQQVEADEPAANTNEPTEDLGPITGPNSMFIAIGVSIEKAGSKAEIDACMTEARQAYAAKLLTADEGKQLGALGEKRKKQIQEEIAATFAGNAA